MKKLLTGLRFVAAVLFSVVFILSVPLALVLYHLEKNVFDIHLWMDELHEVNTYETGYEMALGRLDSFMTSNPNVEWVFLYKNTPPEEMRSFYERVLPYDLFEKSLDETLAQGMDYLTGKGPSVSFSLDGVRGNLKTEIPATFTTDVVYDLLRAQPKCTFDQLAQLVSPGQPLAFCAPPGVYNFIEVKPIVEGQIEKYVQLQTNSVDQFVQEQVILIPETPEPASMVSDLAKARGYIKYLPWFPAASLLLVTLLVVRSFRGWLGWWGGLSLLAGGAGILLFQRMSQVFLYLYENFVSPRLPLDLPVKLTSVVRDAAGLAVLQSLQPVGQQVVFVTAVGVTLVLCSLVLTTIHFYRTKKAGAK